MIYWDDHCLMALTPSPLPPPPLIITYNFKQLWRFLSIAVIIKVSVKENEVPAEKNSSHTSIFATKASYISN